jgi:threonine/homoserine/homoserine lactone efflux protein
MQLILLFIKSVFCGLAASAPVGPMGALCVRRTIKQGYKCGAVTAFGIALSDGLYAVFAVFGVTQIYDFILNNEGQFRLFVGFFLIFIGVKLYFTKLPSDDIKQEEEKQISTIYAFFSSIFLTLTNPLPLLFFVTVFTALVPETGFDFMSGIMVVAGILIGSFAWYMGIVGGVSAFKYAITPSRQIKIDKFIGLFLMVFGISEILRATLT